MAMDHDNMLAWRQPVVHEDHMSYYDPTEFGPPTASSGGYYSVEEEQYDFSYPPPGHAAEPYPVPSNQYGHAGPAYVQHGDHQVHYAPSVPLAEPRSHGSLHDHHQYFSPHPAPGADYDQRGPGDSPGDLDEDLETRLRVARYHRGSDARSSISVEVAPPRGHRHERNREKNRLAASKCREKSKKYVDELRDKERELAAQRASLSAHAAVLKEEVLYLKNEVLRHGDCNCDFIQKYLATAARQIT